MRIVSVLAMGFLLCQSLNAAPASSESGIFPTTKETLRCQGDAQSSDQTTTVELEAGPHDLELLMRDATRGLDRFCSVFKKAGSAALSGECGLVALGEVKTEPVRVTHKGVMTITWSDRVVTRVVTLKPGAGGTIEISIKGEASKVLQGKLVCRAI